MIGPRPHRFSFCLLPEDQASCAGQIFSGRATGESPAGGDYPSWFGEFARTNAHFGAPEGEEGLDYVVKDPAQTQPCPPDAN